MVHLVWIRTKHKNVHLELKSNAKPIYMRPCCVTHTHLSMFKKALDHLLQPGVLVVQKESEWLSPTSIIPKNNRSGSWISFPRHLDTRIKCEQYLILIITNIPYNDVDTNSSPNWTLSCNTMHLILMQQVKIFTLLWILLVNTNH